MTVMLHNKEEFSLLVAVDLGTSLTLMLLVLLVQPAAAASAPSIQLTIFPRSQTVAAGETTALAISVSAPIGWLVNLTATIPFQCFYSIKPQLVQHSENAILLMTVGSEVEAGTYNIVVRGQYGGERSERTVQVNVTAARKLTVSIEPRVLTAGVNTTISFSVSPAVACVVTVRSGGLSYISRFEQGKGRLTVMPQKIEPVIVMVEAQGYLTCVDVIQVEAAKTETKSDQGIRFGILQILEIGMIVAALGAAIVAAKIMMERRGFGRSRLVERRPPPPPPLPPTQGITCPTCQTLTDTRYCPKCGTRIRS